MEIKTAAERTDELISELLGVWEASVRATHHFLGDGDVASIKPQVRQALAATSGLVYSVDAQGRVSGFMAVESGKIEMLFIHPAHLGRGLGRAFIGRAANAFKAALVDVNEQNAQGVEFYKHMGFKVIGRSCRDGNGNPFPILHMSV